MYVHIERLLSQFELDNNCTDKDEGRDAFQILLTSYS